MDGEGRSPDALTLGGFAVAVTLGGGNVLAVRLSNQELPPFWGAGLGFVGGVAPVTVLAVQYRCRMRLR